VRPGELGKLTPADIYDLAAGYRNREERENEKIKIIIDYVCNNLNSRMDYWGSYVCALLSVGLGIKKKAGQEEFLPKPKKEGPADKRSWQDLKADFMAFAAAHNAAIKGR